eukprot:TRINITY_DN11234_c0_g1_i1.p1 TRINITY_DN11234_c0_g1~~TRINITY_DN11234_c0_g1_i1.p1  ORF type:complete len:370 (+),score=66.31 TRINITY_DN11234_c0_g1_i1:16-1125(+)
MKILATVLVIVSIFVHTDSLIIHSEPATAIQQFFKLQNRGEGWLGSDVFTSVNLDENRYLFILGDTLVGNLTKKGHRNWSHMPRNSLATMRITERYMFPPEFYIKYDPNNDNSGFFTSEDKNTWYWPIQGTPIKNQLYILAYSVTSNGTGAFGFSIIGTTIIKVKNPRDEILNWKYTYHPLPNSNSNINWVTAAIAVSDYWYIVGSSEGKKESILTRIKLNDVYNLNWDKFEYWSTIEGSSVPSYHYASENTLLTPIFHPNIPETSLYYHDFLGKWFILEIPAFSGTVNLRTANSIEGPWTNGVPIYQIPEPWNDINDGVFCYAPKYHPMFSENNTLVFSFMSNTFNVEDLNTKTEVYVPQFIRTTFKP